MSEEQNYEPGFPSELVLDDELGPAAHITRGKADALIAAALAEAACAAPEGDASLALLLARETVASDAPATPSSSRQRASGFLRMAVACALAFAFVGSASAAVMWWAQKERAEVAAAAPPAATRAAKRSLVMRVDEPTEPKPTTEPTPAPEPEIVAPARSERKPAKARAPEDFLDEANRLRGLRRWTDADASYARVWQASPSSTAAYVARVASASVRLEHLRDARGAISRYRAALALSPHGPLSEEIRYGIAEAERALGNRVEERRALTAFLAHHPGAALAAKATARLSELEHVHRDGTHE